MMNCLAEVPSVKDDQTESLDCTQEHDADLSAAQCNELERMKQQVTTARLELKNLRKKILDLSFKQKKDVQNIQQLLKECQEKTALHDKKITGSYVDKYKVEKENIHPGLDFSWKPIGYMESAFVQKSGTPRQGCLVAASRGLITISSDVFSNPHHSLLGLQQYSHVWLVFVFHDNGTSCKGFTKAKVSPPRLGGQKLGVFATRSPHRPNPIGLTLAKLDAVVGNSVHVSGVDLLNGTPILDIKPFIPAYDNPASFYWLGTENSTEARNGVKNEENDSHERRAPYEEMVSDRDHGHHETNVSNESHVGYENNVEIVGKHSRSTFDIENHLDKRKYIDHGENIEDFNSGQDDLVDNEFHFNRKCLILSAKSNDLDSETLEETSVPAKLAGNSCHAGDANDALITDRAIVDGCDVGPMGNVSSGCSLNRSCTSAGKTESAEMNHVQRPTTSAEIMSDEASCSLIQIPSSHSENTIEDNLVKVNELIKIPVNSTRKTVCEITREVGAKNDTASDEKINLANERIISTVRNQIPVKKLSKNNSVQQGKCCSSFHRQASSQQLRNAAEEERNLRTLSDQTGVRTAPWLDAAQRTTLEVVINPVAEEQLLMFSTSADNEKYRLKFIADSAALQSLIVESIASDVRSQYRRTHCPDLLYHYCVDSVRVTAAFLSHDQAEILRVTPATGNQ